MTSHPPITKLLPLLSLTAAGVLGSCPDANLLHPCTCEEKESLSRVTCANFSSTNDLQKVFDDTLEYRFDTFFLKDSNIPYLNSSWFALKRTRELHLFNATLVGLFDQPPVDPLPLMSDIYVSYCVLLRRVQWSDFQPFGQLRSLTMLGTEVKVLGREFRENVTPELRELHLIQTKTTALEDGVFGGKEKLDKIVIANNSVSVLKNSYFEDQKESLRVMEFSYNPIESLPDDLFQGLSKLETVWLNGAKIKTFSKNLFENSYATFHFDDNPLACECNMKWITAKRDFGIFGTCDSPAPLKSKHLENLKEKDFDACRRRNDLPFDH